MHEGISAARASWAPVQQDTQLPQNRVLATVISIRRALITSQTLEVLQVHHCINHNLPREMSYPVYKKEQREEMFPKRTNMRKYRVDNQGREWEEPGSMLVSGPGAWLINPHS
jgi:hypothetical protein